MEPNEYITNIVETLSLSKDAIAFATVLYKKAINEGINRDNPKAAVAIACIYSWCLKNKVEIVMYEFESASFIETELIIKAFGDLQNEIQF